MLIVPTAKDPVVLSYLALRQAVGYVALGLPFVVSIGWWLFGGRVLESSISSYYYTGMRNIFVGSLCAIAMFQLCCRGYDIKDEIAGLFSAFCALGVAFFPTTPDCCATQKQTDIGVAHYTFATLLFLTLAYFCLVLFRMSAADRIPSEQKIQRNLVYTVCGVAILVSLAAIVILVKLLHIEYFGRFGTVFIFETTSPSHSESRGSPRVRHSSLINPFDQRTGTAPAARNNLAQRISAGSSAPPRPKAPEVRHISTIQALPPGAKFPVSAVQ